MVVVSKVQELSLHADALPHWGRKEGFREILTNARDEELKSGTPTTFTYKPKQRILRLENSGAVLPAEAMLLGFSSKRENPSFIGTWGEGLKLGVLALVRSGLSVRIRSGSEIWTPKIIQSKRFAAKVLAFQVKSSSPRNSTTVDISPVAPKEVPTIRALVRWFDRSKDEVKVSSGALLLHPEDSGAIYVKGLYVCHMPDHVFGYDLNNIQTDRDRKMVAEHDLPWETSSIWAEALLRRPDLAEKLYPVLLRPDAREVSFLHSAPPEALRPIVHLFDLDYRATIPCRRAEEVQQAAYYGAKAQQFPPLLCSIIERIRGPYHDRVNKLASSPITVYSLHRLSPEEVSNLQVAVAILGRDSDGLAARIQVVDFADPAVQGQHAKGKILLARSVLNCLKTTLAILLHEMAHDFGGDGSVGHTRGIQEIAADALLLAWANRAD